MKIQNKKIFIRFLISVLMVSFILTNSSFAQQISMMLILLISSKGMAGVPRASLVVIASMLQIFNIPAEGLTLLLAIDWLLDMGRACTNVIGNAVATAVISKWEGEMGEPETELKE